MNQDVNVPWDNRAFGWLLIGFLVTATILGTLFSLTTPLFEPPDELKHYQYVRHLLDQGTLPIQRPDEPPSQSHQPPLYYLAGAILVSRITDPYDIPDHNPFWAYEAGQVGKDNKRQFLPDATQILPRSGTALVVLLLRLWSVLLTQGALIAMWQLGRLVWPGNLPKVAAMLSVGALNPMYLYMGGAVNNDSMVIFCGAWVVFLSAHSLFKGFALRTAFAIGAFYGLALVSKLNGLALAAPWMAALALHSSRQRSFRHFLDRFSIITCTTLLVSGPWFIRNYLTYGDPFALEIVLQVWGQRGPDEASLARLFSDTRFAFTNFWGRFGYGQVPMPSWFYLLFFFLTLISTMGIFVYVIRLGSKRPWHVGWGHWLVLGTTSLGFVVAMLYYLVRNPTGGNGRYLYPAMPAFSAVMIAGFSIWFDRLRRPSWAYASLTCLMAGLAVYTLIFLHHTYSPPPRYASPERLEIPSGTDLVYPELGTLIGYGLHPDYAAPGEALDVTLFWQVTGDPESNHRMFLQLVDRHGVRIAGRDTHPGLGNYPTSLWRPGEIIADTVRIAVPPGHRAPTGVYLNLGFWSEDGSYLLPTRDGHTTATLGIIRLGTSDPPMPPEDRLYVLSDVVELTRIAPPSEVSVPGATLHFSLVWRALANPSRDYSVFVHLIDAEGGLVATFDRPPQQGTFPTSLWHAGDLVTDERQIELPWDLGPGTYRVVAGWYCVSDFSRLPARDAAGQALDNGAIPLFSIVVER